MKVLTALLFGTLLTVCTAGADPRAWGEHGLPVRQGMHLKWNQGMARDNYGNTLLVWSEKSSGQRDVRAQLINSSGQPQWTENGVNVTPEVHFQDRPVAVAVDGGWIVAWVDFRDTTNCDYYWDYYTCCSVYAQKLDYFGNRLWPDNDFTGVEVNPNVEEFDKFTLRMVPDAAGGAILTWNEYSTEFAVRAQRVDGNGEVVWPEPVQISDSNYISLATVAPGSDGSVLMAWTSYAASGLRVGKIMPDGTIPWGEYGVQVSGDYGTYGCGIVTDGADGCYVVWGDVRSGSVWQLYAQHLTSDGEPTWVENGISVSIDGHEATLPDLALSTTGGEVDGIVVAWTQNEQEDQYAIRVQKISPEGAVAWAEGGIMMADVGVDSWGARSKVTTDFNGGMVVMWQDNSGDIPHCFASRVRWNGTLAWGSDPVAVGNPMSPSANSYYYVPQFAIAGNFGTYLVAYVGVDSLGMEGIRYQLLDHVNGARLLGPAGTTVVSGVGGDASLSCMAPMSGNRTAVFWTEGRFGGYTWSGPLYYQIVSADGQIQRATNGERLVPNNSGSSSMTQYGAQTCDDGAGGVFVSYQDFRTNASVIRVSHVSESGDVVGPDSGMVAWWQEGVQDQNYPYICPDGQEGCYVAWTGYDQNYSRYVYVMRLNSNLQRAWNQPVCMTDTSSNSTVQGLVSAPDHSCIAVWIFGNYQNYDISAARIRDDGTVAWRDTVCQAPGHQINATAVGDGAGGVYVVWTDSRSSQQNGPDIYAQRIAGDGTPYWAANGVSVYSGAEEQSTPQVALDSGSRLCVTWLDRRDSGYGPRVYAQRMSPEGTPLWDDDGVRVNTTYTYTSQVVASSRDGIFALWGRCAASVFAMHLDSAGAIFDDPFWQPDTGGVVAMPTDEHDFSEYPQAVSDGWGGCVAGWIKWEDEYEYYPDRGGELYTSDIYVQHLFDYPNAARDRRNAVPQEYALYQNYPNPFNPVTRIAFDLPAAGKVKLLVYDLLGRRVASLVNGHLEAGQHQVSLDASSFASGVYFYRIEAGSFVQSRKMVVLK